MGFDICARRLALGLTMVWALALFASPTALAIADEPLAPAVEPEDGSSGGVQPAPPQRLEPTPVDEDSPPAAEMPDESKPEGDQTGDEPKPIPSEEKVDAPAELPDGAAHAVPSPLKSDEQPQAEAAETTLRPAGFKGVFAGQTKRDALHAAWGKPKQTEKIAGGVRDLFAVEGSQNVRATIVDDVVTALAIRLDKPVSVDDAAKALELEGIEPVDVLDEKGQLLGCALPESGVLLGFVARSNPPRVFQIVIEPIDAQPFVARAEKRLMSRYAECLADLKVALAMAPENPRAHWLFAELNFRTGSLESALESVEKGITLEPKEPEYRLTLARILGEGGDYPQAIGQVRGVIEWGKAPPQTVARAYCLWGDFLAAAHEHEYTEAIKQHMQAIKLAEPLVSHPKVAVRRAAKELLLDANLAVAHDVGWGRWQQKSKVVPKWIERATAIADDLIAREQASSTVRLRLYAGALSALAGIAEPPDASGLIKGLRELGRQTFEEASDPIYKAQVAWSVATALGDAVEIDMTRHRADEALENGQVALEYFEKGDEAGQRLPNHDFLLGRLFYRMGAVSAIDKGDHKQGVAWFDQAVPMLESPVPAASVNGGKHGEMFVSMAVSYWQINNRTEAVRLTTQGVQLMEQAAAEGLMSQAALAIPYGNLASMYEQMGDSQSAKKYSEMAARQEPNKPNKPK